MASTRQFSTGGGFPYDNSPSRTIGFTVTYGKSELFDPNSMQHPFEGTGKVWRLWSPLSFWVENLGDDYSAWAFETTENTYIRVDLPSFRDMVVISSPGPVEVKTLRACDGIKK